MNKLFSIFVGRWNPFRDRHAMMVKKVCDEKGTNPLIFVRDTDYDILTAEQRADIIREWAVREYPDCQVIIIPDIDGVYYGREVGYAVECIELPEDENPTSATELRDMIFSGDKRWKSQVAPGTEKIVQRYFEAVQKERS
jgi:adenylylsulfate kinase